MPNFTSICITILTPPPSKKGKAISFYWQMQYYNLKSILYYAGILYCVILFPGEPRVQSPYLIAK